jgi:hypothetical protein
LIERSEKEKKVSALARWGGPEGRRRSKQERIKDKMGEAQCEEVEHKKRLGRRKEVGEREYSETILLLSRARAGSSKISLFFYI